MAAPGHRDRHRLPLARRVIVGYLAWYNGTRLHSTLGYRSPAEFEEHDKIKKVA